MRRVRPGLERERETDRQTDRQTDRDRDRKTHREFRLDSDDFGFICAGVSNVGSYKRNAS